jgi:hypothetical protein
MNKKAIYLCDTRYEKVWEQMELLGIQDVTTNRQHRNGTRVWRLPIKMEWPKDKNGKGYKCIEVASFSTGYVRNQNSASSNYQLNKQVDGEPEYFKLSNGDYRKYTGKERVLIPIEIDRLEYLISYCLKNYYIKNANQVADGDFYPKWMYENAIEDRDNQGWRTKVKDLENKLDTIKRIADYE